MGMALCLRMVSKKKKAQSAIAKALRSVTKMDWIIGYKNMGSWGQENGVKPQGPERPLEN